MASPVHVVLDTNIWLDIVVFNAHDHNPMRKWLSEAQWIVHVNPAILDEIQRVLNYACFQLSPEQQTLSLAYVVQHSTLHTEPCPPKSTFILPKCSDRDDQKFLELAHCSKATYLISKDKQVLKCARSVKKLNYGFQILNLENFFEVMIQTSKPVD
jgi:uncharacterized protein